VSNLIDVEPADVHNELPVVAVFLDVDGVRLPQFRPADQSAWQQTSARP
jgi:hypothetical protein